jgi:hypothetical protein
VFGLNYKLVQFRVDCRRLPRCSGRHRHRTPWFGDQFRAGPGGPLLSASRCATSAKLQLQNQAQADELPTRPAIGALYEVRFRPPPVPRWIKPSI